MTLLEVLKTATAYLGTKGIQNARLDAEVLLAHVLGMARIQLYVHFDRPFEPHELSAYREAVAQRAARVPVAYIVGRKEFYGREFAVDRRVLIPRPETEHLVESALRRLNAVATPRVADIGCGSGAIGITIACELPAASVWATDASAAALEVARTNAERLDAAARVQLSEGDLFAALPDGVRAGLDAVLSNPPYVSSAELSALQPELRFEPKEALSDGRDGLTFYRRLAAEGRDWVAADGFLACEMGAGQLEAVRGIFARAGWREADVVHDLAGHARVFVATQGPGAQQGSVAHAR